VLSDVLQVSHSVFQCLAGLSDALQVSHPVFLCLAGLSDGSESLYFSSRIYHAAATAQPYPFYKYFRLSRHTHLGGQLDARKAEFPVLIRA
jgi:hypothetical protein